MLGAALQAKLDQIENWVRMALSRAGSGDTLATQLEYTFIFRPGATPPLAPNVFTTWPTLDAAMGKVQGPKLLLIDGSGGGSLTVPAGTWKHSFQDVTYVSEAGEQLNFAVGAIIDPTVTNLALARGMAWQNGASVVFTPTGTVLLYTYDVGTGFGGTAGFPFIDVPAGATLNFEMASGSGIGDTVNPAINVAAGGTLGLSNLGGTLVTNSLSGAGTFNYLVDAAAETDYPLGLTITAFTYFGPANVIRENNAAGVGAGASINHSSAGTIQRKGSGTVLLNMQISLAQSAGAGTPLVTVQATRDGVPIVGSPIVEASILGGTTVLVPYVWADVLPDNAAHHYGWVATTPAGTISVAGGASSIVVVEQL